MWLLDTVTHSLSEVASAPDLPYAILSHKWCADEITFADIQANQWHHKTGSKKLIDACKQAHKDGYSRIWIDTCCIDKRNSADLSDAINSMFAYYQAAQVCYAYLFDVVSPDVGMIGESVWFARAWTLQELIAAKKVVFYNRDWVRLGAKTDLGVVRLLNGITGIPERVLLGQPVSTCNIAQRMSWASKRTATRPEDIAYSLMGLFGVHMTPLYGEGAEKAFFRLQDQILKTTADQTLFLWVPALEKRNQGLLATKPSSFSGDPKYYGWMKDFIDDHDNVQDCYEFLYPRVYGDFEIEFNEAGQYNYDNVPWTTNHCSFPSLGPHGLQISLPLEVVCDPKRLHLTAGRRLVALDIAVRQPFSRSDRRVYINLQSETKLNLPETLPKRVGNMSRIPCTEVDSSYMVSVPSAKRILKREPLFVSQVDVIPDNDVICQFSCDTRQLGSVIVDIYLDQATGSVNDMTDDMLQGVTCRGGAFRVKNSKHADIIVIFGTHGMTEAPTPWLALTSLQYLHNLYGSLKRTYDLYSSRSSRYGSTLARYTAPYSGQFVGGSIAMKYPASKDAMPRFCIKVDITDRAKPSEL